jgi:photosystem II stability/assembly factor-like uncharacterized protein
MNDVAEQVVIDDVVYALAASPNFARDGVCFAARQRGLYRSDDGGVTWGYAYDSLGLDVELATSAVAVSPDFVSDGCVFAGSQGVILCSTNGGETWNVVPLASPPPMVSAIVVSPNFVQDGTLLVGTLEDGVFLSSNRGGQFYRWNFGLLDLSVLSMAISPAFAVDETLFVGTESGIFRSTNGGRAWREVDFPLNYAPVISLALSFNYADDGVLFAGTEEFGLFRSDDKGQTWSRLADEVIVEAVNAIVLSSDPTALDILVALGSSLLISRDGGHSWADWEESEVLAMGVSSVIAPQDLVQKAPLLVGLVGGEVARL